MPQNSTNDTDHYNFDKKTCKREAKDTPVIYSVNTHDRSPSISPIWQSSSACAQANMAPTVSLMTATHLTCRFYNNWDVYERCFVKLSANSSQTLKSKLFCQVWPLAQYPIYSQLRIIAITAQYPIYSQLRIIAITGDLHVSVCSEVLLRKRIFYYSLFKRLE